jgi:fibrillarin-like rRNA methylase
VLVIHPDYLLAQLSEEQFKVYCERRQRRQHAAYRHWQNALTGKASFIKVKDAPPYSLQDEQKVIFNEISYQIVIRTTDLLESKGTCNIQQSAEDMDIL